MSRRRYTPLGDDVPGVNVGVGVDEDENEREDGRPWDPRFDDKDFRPFPYREVVQAILLLGMGTLFIVIALLQHHGHVGSKPGQILGFSSLAFISFLPGFYASRIAYYSWRGRRGYNVHQIPSS
jgi:hypothetical protein